MKTTLQTLFVTVAVLFVHACSADAGSDIVDIGKACDSPSDCQHVCVGEAGQTTGQCSIECVANSDCPSFMDCITSSSTGERRCFDLGGLVVSPLAVQCLKACGDVNYFCSTDAVTDADEEACDAGCNAAAEPEQQQFIDCVNASERYTSACPATDCMVLIR